MGVTFSFVFLFLFVTVFVVVFGGMAFAYHPIAGIAVAILLYYLFFYSHLRVHLNWKKLPTLDRYAEQYPECLKGRGVSCSKCNSNSLKNWGVNSANDKRRIHICNHCNSKLYRSE